MAKSAITLLKSFFLHSLMTYTLKSMFVSFLNNLEQKMRAAFILPAIGCSVTFLIIVAHFDSKYFPDVWREIFQDGSRSELYIIYALIAFWIAGLYICTGIHSVGYVQANVFFSSWAAFATSLMGLKLWRESAGLPSLFQKLANHTRMTSKSKISFLFVCTINFSFHTSTLTFSFFVLLPRHSL